MIENADDETASLYEKMEKYNFNKEFNVAISIIDDDHNMEHSEPNIENRNKEEIIRAEIMDTETRQEKDVEITSVFFENARKSINKLFNVADNNNNEKSHSNVTHMSAENSNKTTEVQNNSQTNVNSSNTILLRSPVISHTCSVDGTTSCRCLDANAEMNKNHDDLYVLSRYMLIILKNYNHFKRYYYECDEKLKKICNERYTHFKQRYFRVCVHIVKRFILPLGDKFNVQDFLNKTMSIASPSDIKFITHRSLETLYNDIMASCYKQLSGPEVTHNHNNMNANVMNKGHNLVPQPNVQNCGNHSEAQATYNLYHQIVQQNVQNNSDNITQNMNNGSNYRQDNNGCNPILQQISHNNRQSINTTEDMNLHSRNITQTVNYGPNPVFQDNLRNYEHCNINQTIKGPNSSLQQNSNIERLKSCVAMSVINAPNPVMQEIIRNNKCYYDGTQMISNIPTSATDANYKKNPQFNNAAQNRNQIIQSQFNQNIENNQNCNKEPRNSSEVSRTCVFQYQNPNYEVRLDVDTNLLNQVQSNQIQVNNYLPAEDPNSVRKQYSSSDVRRSGQAVEPLNVISNQIPYQDVSHIVQEPARSTSRDSGFMSPCNNQMYDACNVEAQDTTAPYITNVTSLNPNAIQIPQGVCLICGTLTKNKCLGCFKYYYCSHKCQVVDREADNIPRQEIYNILTHAGFIGSQRPHHQPAQPQAHHQPIHFPQNHQHFDSSFISGAGLLQYL